MDRNVLAGDRHLSAVLIPIYCIVNPYSNRGRFGMIARIGRFDPDIVRIFITNRHNAIGTGISTNCKQIPYPE